MVDALGAFALGLLLLALGGDSAVKGVSGLAQRLGLRPFTAGLLLLAFGTSLPELAVNLRALVVGQPQLALGNAVGSTLVNLGLALGVAALAAPLLPRARMHVPLLVLLAVASLAVLVFGLDGELGRVEGAVLLAGFAAVVVFLLRRSAQEPAPVQAAVAAFAATRTDLVLNLIRLAIASALLYYGARLVVSGAVDLGQALGLAPLLAGLLPLAIGTALPEIAAMVMAARRGHGDMVAGHVVGASLFNLLVIVGGMALLQPLALPMPLVQLALPAAVVLALVLYPQLRGHRPLGRTTGVVLVALFAAWVALELLRR